MVSLGTWDYSVITTKMILRHLIRHRFFLSQLPKLVKYPCLPQSYYKSIELSRYFSIAKSTHGISPSEGNKINVLERIIEEFKLSTKMVENLLESGNSVKNEDLLDLVLDEQTHADDRKWDFLDTIELIVKLEEALGISLDDSVCGNVKTLRDIVNAFESELEK